MELFYGVWETQVANEMFINIPILPNEVHHDNKRKDKNKKRGPCGFT